MYKQSPIYKVHHRLTGEAEPYTEVFESYSAAVARMYAIATKWATTEWGADAVAALNRYTKSGRKFYTFDAFPFPSKDGLGYMFMQRC